MATASAHTTVQDEVRLIACLTDLMKQEQQFLVAADSDGLTTLTPLKNDLIEQMAALAKQRHVALAAVGHAPSEAGMQEWLAQVSNPLFSEQWQQLLDKTREAKELNRVNGMLINKHMTQNAILINAMRTTPGSADTGFYGPSGQATPVGGKRRFVVG